MDEPLFIIPKDLLQSTVNYLAKQPYIEVFELIGHLKSLGVADIPELKPKKGRRTRSTSTKLPSKEK